MTMKEYILTLAIVLVHLQITDGLQCLHCKAVLSPLLCNRINVCTHNEVCLTAKYTTSNGEVLYNVGCFQQNSCLNATIANPQQGVHPLAVHLDPADHLQCSYCCSTDGCNQRGCGNPSFDDIKHGPLCYDCHQTKNPATCSYVKTCEQNEECQVYTGNIFGRKRQANLVSECCTTNLCNFRRSGPRDCMEIKRWAKVPSGVYTIFPAEGNSVSAYCDMTTDGGGWTVLVARSNETFPLNRTWDEYKKGFGNANGNYFIGNDNIHLLTLGRPSEIYFKLQSLNGSWYYAIYDVFSIGPESDGYRLHFNGTSYRGNAGESLHRHDLNGRKFSSFDNEEGNSYQCATYSGGGWWYYKCEFASLMSETFYEWRYNVGDLRGSVMMIKAMS